MSKEGWAVSTDCRLDPFEQQTEKQVFPRFVRAQPRAGGAGQSRSVAGGVQHIGSGQAREGLGHGQSFEFGQVRVRAAAVTAGGNTARRNASVSSMRSDRAAPGRYHSSMVNSGACSALPSPFRHTRAS